MPADVEYVFGPFRLQPLGRQLLREGEPVRLGARAFDLLHVLVERAGSVLSNNDLLTAVWGGTVVDDGSVRVHISALRKALGDDATQQRFVANIPQRGYRFLAHVDVQQRGGAGQADVARLASGGALRSMVKLPLSQSQPRLVGREEAVQSTVSQLRRCRLVTLVGPGGIGKTSVAQEVMRRSLADFTDGACFVDLGSVSDASLVASSFASALAIPVLSDDALARVIARLHGKSMLMVVDNCEHVIEAAASVIETLMRRAAGVKVLATSREALRTQGEWIQRVGGLGSPVGPDLNRAAHVLAFPAVELLVERVRSTQGEFELTDADAAAAAAICSAMDGIPLAIELVATHVPNFGIQGLARLLADSLGRLTHGRRTVLARHQTMRATLDWSFALLAPEEQAVFRRLAVFRGPFTAYAASAVCHCHRIDGATVSEALVGLVNKSLVNVDVDSRYGKPHYRLLETTREYARERLEGSGETHAVSRLHAEFLRSALRRSATEAKEMEGAEWRALSALRIEDLRDALTWSFSTHGDLVLGVELAVTSSSLWFLLGLVKEYRDWLDKVKPMLQSLPVDDARGMHFALARGHAYLHTAGPSPVTDEELGRAVVLGRRVGTVDEQLGALWSFYTEKMVRADYPGTLVVAKQFGELAELADDGQPRLTYHRMMAMAIHMSGELASSLGHAQRALQSPSTRLPYRHGSAYQVDHQAATMTPMARVLWLQGRADDAVALAAESVERAASLDHGFSMTFTLALAACPIAIWTGDLDQARRYGRMLLDCAARHTLDFWLLWGQMYEQLLDWWSARGSTDVAWLERFASHPSRVDILATFAPELLHPNAVRRLEAGLNPWCAVELHRVHVVRRWRAGQVDLAGAVAELESAAVRARREGALAWELRATMSLGECMQAQGDGLAASDRLEALLSQFQQGRLSADILSATSLLAKLRS